MKNKRHISNPVTDRQSEKSLALVIGSGGIKCAASIGLWKTLRKASIELDLVVGSSGGSLYAAAIALGWDDETLAAKTFDLWTPDIAEGYTTNLRAVMSGEVSFSAKSGLVNDRKLYERLQHAFGDTTFDQTNIPLKVAACDFHTGENVIIESGRIVDALRASVSIPFLFPPYEIGDKLLVDGAVCNPLPIDIAIREGSEIILAMGFELPTRRNLRSYAAVSAHYNSIYMNNILKSAYAFHNLAHHSEIVTLLPEFEKTVGTFDHHLIPHVIEAGEAAAAEQLDYIQRLLLRNNEP